MESPNNIGPEWFWRIFPLLVVIASGTILVGLLMGIAWLLNHIHID